MMGLPSERRNWAGATALSCAIHGGVIAVFFGLPLVSPPETAPLSTSRIEVTALTLPTDIVGDTAPMPAPSAQAPSTPTLTANPPPAPDPTSHLSEPAVDDAIAPLPTPLPDGIADAVSPPPEGAGADRVTAGGIAAGGAAADGMGAGGTETATPDTAAHPSKPITADPANTVPSDPRLAQLFSRIRERLTDPCLLALPELKNDGSVQLSVLAANDAQISSLTASLTDGLDVPVSRQAVLIDPRQCSGLTLARNDALYPSFGLTVQIATPRLQSGASLRGRILGADGSYTNLILVDDNGVVHDLSGYLLPSDGGNSFDVPLARMGAARDTHQLVIAVATPARSTTLDEHNGESAGAFFPRLVRELGPRYRIGIASVYLR